MTRIAVAECKQEVSSFNPVPSGYADFIVTFGPAIFAHHRRVRNEVGGALSVFDARPDLELIPTYSARAITSGGTLAADAWHRIAAEFLESLRSVGPVDAAYFSLHGAMSAVGEDDPEGYLLQEARAILGEDVPIVVSLDLHGILTDRMLEHSDAVVVYHTYPHVDFYETGARAARLLLRILGGGGRPVTAKVEIPALVRGDELITATGLFGRSILAAQEVENSPGGLSAGMFIGNPFTDVRDLRSNSLVVTNDDPERAAREAERLAADFWAVRHRLQADLTPLDAAVDIAMQHDRSSGTIILVDAADAPSSGAPGDSNAILAALLNRGYTGRALIPIVDPGAVHAALAAGVGNTVVTSVGGAFDNQFTPYTIEGRVQVLSEGRFRSERQAEEWRAGRTAVILVGTITLVITSRAVSLYDRSLFYAHGQDPTNFDLVVVKSPHCEHHMYAEWAARLVNVDAPGATSANLPRLGHTRCTRPVFPLDPDVAFTPEAKIFQRPRWRREGA